MCEQSLPGCCAEMRGQGSKGGSREGQETMGEMVESTEGDENWLDSGPISKEEPIKGLHEGFWLEQLDKGVVSLSCPFWKSGSAYPMPLRGERKPSGSRASPSQSPGWPFLGL